MSSGGAMKAILCQICEEAVGLGGELRPTGALCAECVGKEPQAPTNNPRSNNAPRAAEEHTESKGEPTPLPGIAGDRAGIEEATSAIADASSKIFGILAEAGEIRISHLRAFDPPKTREVASIEIEEWIYGAFGERPDLSLQERLVLQRTPFEFHHRADLVGGIEVCRFVVVLEWRVSDEATAPAYREIGPSFEPRMGSRADRAAALNTARAWAWGQTKKLKAVGPMSYRPAREN